METQQCVRVASAESAADFRTLYGIALISAPLLYLQARQQRLQLVLRQVRREVDDKVQDEVAASVRLLRERHAVTDDDLSIHGRLPPGRISFRSCRMKSSAINNTCSGFTRILSFWPSMLQITFRRVN